MSNIDTELEFNRVVDKYGEIMRLGMRQPVKDKFDALTPDARRDFILERMVDSGEERPSVEDVLLLAQFKSFSRGSQ